MLAVDDELNRSLMVAVRALRAGQLAVLPTDTVYGVAALPGAPGAVEAIFAAKGRPEDKPLPVMVANFEDAALVANLDDRARAIGRRFWPGPLTLVLPRAAGFEYDLGGATQDKETVAVRIPDCEPACEILAMTGPLAVTSANQSGESPATTVAEARDILGEHVDVFIDGGVCDGPSSTVVALLDRLEILRDGPISRSELDQTLMS